MKKEYFAEHFYSRNGKTFLIVRESPGDEFEAKTFVIETDISHPEDNSKHARYAMRFSEETLRELIPVLQRAIGKDEK